MELFLRRMSWVHLPPELPVGFWPSFLRWRRCKLSLPTLPTIFFSFFSLLTCDTNSCQYIEFVRGVMRPPGICNAVILHYTITGNPVLCEELWPRWRGRHAQAPPPECPWSLAAKREQIVRVFTSFLLCLGVIVLHSLSLSLTPSLLCIYIML